MNESSKKERLRNGEAVELKPGVFGRINKENRTLELDSGKILPIGKNDQRDLFPENEQALDVARRTEKLEGQVKKAPFGEFFHQVGQSGITSAPKDWLDYLTKTGDQYLAQKEAQKRVSERISNESPITSGAATVASFVPDLMLTGGMSATKAAPILTALSAGSRIVSEPQEVGKEALLAAGLGKFIDIGGNALNKNAARRGAARALPGQRQAVAESNRLGQEAVNEANALQNSEFNFLKQNIKDTNKQKLLQYQDELDLRKNRLLEATNQRNSAKFANSQERKRINEEFKLADRQYKEALQNLPNLQKEAQREFSANVIRNAEKIENAFPKNSKISGIDIDVPGFFDQTLKNQGMLPTQAEAQSKKILSSLFSPTENFTAKELSSKYRAIEEAIEKGSPEVQQILSEFKNHLGNKLPTILTDNISFSRVVPSLKKQIEREVESAMKKIPEMKNFASSAQMTNKFKNNINNYFNELSPRNFLEKLRNGELREEILNKFLSPYDVFTFENSFENLNKLRIKNIPEAYKARFEIVKDIVSGKIDNALANAEIKAIASDIDAAKKLGTNVNKTFGMAEPVPTPSTPNQPNFEGLSGELPPIQAPPFPQKPNLMPEPTAPIPQTFSPQPEPMLSPASGMNEKLADFLEKGISPGKSTLLNNPLTKLAGLKYALGSAALPVEAAGAAGYLVMKGLTSPTTGGTIARETFKQSGIKAIESWAQRYPSYNNGILNNPQDRRSLSKEIEDDYEIPIEQKAITQSKINRGIPLQQRL